MALASVVGLMSCRGISAGKEGHVEMIESQKVDETSVESKNADEAACRERAFRRNSARRGGRRVTPEEHATRPVDPPNGSITLEEVPQTLHVVRGFMIDLPSRVRYDGTGARSVFEDDVEAKLETVDGEMVWHLLPAARTDPEHRRIYVLHWPIDAAGRWLTIALPTVAHEGDHFRLHVRFWTDGPSVEKTIEIVAREPTPAELALLCEMMDASSGAISPGSQITWAEDHAPRSDAIPIEAVPRDHALRLALLMQEIDWGKRPFQREWLDLLQGGYEGLRLDLQAEYDDWVRKGSVGRFSPR